MAIIGGWTAIIALGTFASSMPAHGIWKMLVVIVLFPLGLAFGLLAPLLIVAMTWENFMARKYREMMRPGWENLIITALALCGIVSMVFL